MLTVTCWHANGTRILREYGNLYVLRDLAVPLCSCSSERRLGGKSLYQSETMSASTTNRHELANNCVIVIGDPKWRPRDARVALTAIET